MVTQLEAQLLAQQHIQKYLLACSPATEQDVANALMKLCSVAGVAMSAAVGREEAASRLHGTAAFITSTVGDATIAPGRLH